MKRIGLFLALLLIFLLPSGYALATSRYDRIIKKGETVKGGITLFDDDLIVEEGGTVDGDVTIFGGQADVSGTITGDVAIFDGSMELAGSVGGDLVVFGGDLHVEETSSVGGDCFALGGEVVDDSDDVSCSNVARGFAASGVLDSIRPFVPPEAPTPPRPPTVPEFEVREPSAFSGLGRFLLNVSEVVGRSLLLGILALIVTAVFPRQLEQVSATIRRKPAASGAVGLLTAVAGPSLIVLLLVVLAITCVGLLLYPAVFLLALALLAAALLGWIALGDILGRMLLRSFRVAHRNLPVTAALGTALLTFVLGGLGLLPFVWGESLVVLLLACVGLGAAALTQFGTKPYPPGTAPAEDREKVEAAMKTLPPETEDRE